MLIPVILSGGSGSRLWPVSREAHPKPFMKLADGQSLLQKTLLRAVNLPDVSEILTVTNREYYFKSKDEYAALGKQNKSTPLNFLLEPVGRNTAPAIAVAAFNVLEKFGKDACLLILAADHIITNADAFNEAVKHAYKLAQQNYLVTFGLTPDAPETGFGYIECGKACNETNSFLVKQFVEKPSLEKAKEYLAANCYLWNSGMFCFKASNILENLQQHAPELYAQAKTCWEITKKNQNDKALELSAEFATITDISIDYAVMEKAQNVAVVRSSFDWSDVGSWHAVSELAPPDEHGNRVVGEALLLDVANTYVQSEDRMIAAIGLDNLIIVDTPDALLVANRDRSQDVKKVVDQLKMAEHETYKLHKTVSRPWGTYTILEEGKGFKIKRIVVKPGASLSLQMHHHRSEHWVVVSGTARVVNGEQTLIVRKNESTYIPAGHQHRLENPGILDLVLIEVQSGDYLGEDDIVRFEDIYGRVEPKIEEVS